MCEPAAHQLAVAASCPGLTPFHTHKPDGITVRQGRGRRGLTLSDTSHSLTPAAAWSH